DEPAPKVNYTPFWNEMQALMDDKRQIVFYGPPGTGKTWLARQFARYWIDAADERGGEVQVVQFHPSYAYEEFVEGIRPESVAAPDGRHELTYRVKTGIFRRFCDEARAHPRRRYVLILDEINRGELPRILGELLYLKEVLGKA
ncbi:MAG: AAA family ATPase, partial [Anaerolineae bacterium]|nr:AAA family ATPase [Anaerolineae bacterium]